MISGRCFIASNLELDRSEPVQRQTRFIVVAQHASAQVKSLQKTNGDFWLALRFCQLGHVEIETSFRLEVAGSNACLALCDQVHWILVLEEGRLELAGRSQVVRGPGSDWMVETIEVRSFV